MCVPIELYQAVGSYGVNIKYYSERQQAANCNKNLLIENTTIVNCPGFDYRIAQGSPSVC